MILKEQYENMRYKLIDNIEFVALHCQPEGWLPVKASALVFPDYGDSEDDNPMLEHCMIQEIFDSGECHAITLGSNEDNPYGLSEFLTESLLAIWEKYVRLSVEQSIWKENARAYLKEYTELSSDKIEAHLDKHWDTNLLFTENLTRI